MEKPHIQFSVAHTLSLARGIVERTMNANTLWRIIIGSTVVAIMSIGVFAYFTYTWANSTQLSSLPTKRDHNTFSSADLKNAILLYREKEERYNILLTTSPAAPMYAKGKGVMALPPEVPQENNVASGTPLLMPQGKGTSTVL